VVRRRAHRFIRRKAGKLLPTVLIFAFVGLIINTTILFGIAMCSPMPDRLPHQAAVLSSGDDRAWAFIICKGFGFTRYFFVNHVNDSTRTAWIGFDHSRRPRPDLLPHWGALSAPPVEDEQSGLRVQQSIGWPMNSAWCELGIVGIRTRRSGNHNLDVFQVWRSSLRLGGIPIDSSETERMFQKCIPFRPIWVGLCTNVVFYGTAMAIVVAMGHQTRNRLRRINRQCPNCRYELRGLDGLRCPECGWNRPAPGG
jgi:hypothetical protein